MLEVWANLDLQLPLARVAETARRAERLGYDVLSIPDLVHDGIAACALAAEATGEIRLTTSALIAFPRSPMTVAVAAWDLQALSQGRFSLGLGPQIRPMIVDRFSTPWTPPAPRMRDYVGAVRAIFACWRDRTPLHFESEHYRFTRMQPYTSPPPIAHPEIPIRLAGIGPNMLAVAGEVADGLVTHPTSACPRYLDERVAPALARGASRSGRDPATVSIVANPLCATGRDAEAVRSDREAHRQLLATLFSTPSYWPALELYDRAELGPRLNGLVREGRWEALGGELDDELLDALVPAAPWEPLAERLAERYAGLARAVTFPMPEDEADDPTVARAIARLKAGA